MWHNLCTFTEVKGREINLHYKQMNGHFIVEFYLNLILNFSTCAMKEINKNVKNFIIFKVQWRDGQVDILPQAQTILDMALAV